MACGWKTELSVASGLCQPGPRVRQRRCKDSQEPKACEGTVVDLFSTDTRLVNYSTFTVVLDNLKYPKCIFMIYSE